MVITIQAVEERLFWVRKMQGEVSAVVYIDHGKEGSFSSFREMLKIEVNNYRLHLQDDVILSKRISEYLPYLENEMKNKDIHLLSLFAPRRKHILESFNRGETFALFPNYLWLQASIFSKHFIDLMRLEITTTKQNKHDDVFVAEVLKKYKIPAYVHIPSIVQHNTDIKSTMGHSNTYRRESSIYDHNYVTKFLETV
jgi:hypothetical protein